MCVRQRGFNLLYALIDKVKGMVGSECFFNKNASTQPKLFIKELQQL